MTIWYCPSVDVLGLVSGDFIHFVWNNRYEESYFPVLRDEGYWEYICEL